MSSSQSPMSQPISDSTQFNNPYIFDQVTLFNVKELITRPDSFIVEKLPEKLTLFTTTGKAIDFNGRKKLKDCNDDNLFEIIQNTTSTLLYMYIYDYITGQRYTLRKKGWLPGRGRGTILVWKGEKDEGEPFIEMQAQNLSKTKFIIKDLIEGNQLAVVSRNALSARRIFGGADTHQLTVNAGVNVAFMAILTVALDEQYTEYAA